MWKVNIYIETSTAYQKKTERWYGYVLECQRKDGTPETREDFFHKDLTYNQAVLDAIAKALERVNTSCEICIYTENTYTAFRMLKLPDLMAAGFKDAQGEPIKNQDQWIEIYSKAKEHIITASTEKHSYSGWMKRRMEELKSEEKESIKSSEEAKENCKNGRCETGIFYKDKCFLRAWPAPAFWPIDNLEEGEHDVR